MRRAPLHNALRCLRWALPPALFLVWAVRFARAAANPAIPAFGDVDRQIALARAQLWGDAVWGAILLAVWVAAWGLPRAGRALGRSRRAKRSGAREPQNLTL